MRLRTIATASLAVTLSSAGAFAQDAAQSGSFDAQSAVESFLANPDVLGTTSSTVGSVTTDDQTVTATDISMTWSWTMGDADAEETADVDLTVAVPTLEITDLTYTDTYNADRITVPEVNVSFTMTGADQDLDYSFVVRDYVTTNASWAALPTLQENAAAPLSRFAPLLEAALEQSYDSARMGGMSGTITTGDDRQTFDYGPSTYGKLENGVIELFTIGAGTTSQTMAQPADATAAGVPTTITINYGEATGEMMDIKPLVSLLTGSNAAEGPQTFIQSMSLGGIRFGAGDMANFSMGATTVSDVTIDPSRGPILTRADDIYTAVADNEEPDVGALMSFMLDTYGAIGIGSYQIDGFDMSFPQGEAQLGKVAIENLNAGGLGLLSFNGVSVRGSGADGALGKFEVADVTFPDRDAFMSAMMASMAGLEPTPQQVLQAIPYVGRITVSGFELNGSPVGDLALGLFEARATNFIESIPTQISLALEGFSMPATLISNPMAQGVFTAVGADPVQADGTITFGWDEANKQVSLDEDISVNNIGRLQMSAQMSGIPRFVFAEPQRIQEALVTAAIDGVSARFEDAGITEFGINMMAQQAGMPASEFPSIIAQQVQMQIAAMTGNPDLAEQVSGAISAFLSDPQSLAIAASPANPVPLAQVMGAAMTAPQAIPELLGLTIDANSAAQ